MKKIPNLSIKDIYWVKPKIHKTNNIKELEYSDITRMIYHIKTYEFEKVTQGRKKSVIINVLTEESRQDVLDWAKETLKYIFNDSLDSIYVKIIQYDHKTKIETIDWVSRNCTSIFGNKDYLTMNVAQFSETSSIKTVGALIEFFVRTHQIPRFDRIICD